MQDIANEVGVSKTTISFVLNNTPNANIPMSTRERVLTAAQELGYVHNSKRQIDTIALLIRRPPGHLVQAVHALEVMQGLSAAVEPYNYQVTLREIPEDSDFSYLAWTQKGNFAAVALDNILKKDIEEIQQLAKDTTVIGISQCSIPGVSYVDVDNVRGAYIVVDYLLALGHRRIGMINYASSDHLISSYRLVGYQQALTQYDIIYNEKLIRYANFTSESGQTAMADLLDTIEEPPTAIFVAGDVVAAGAMQAVRERGLSIPEDVSFASFNDVPFARYLTPPLTTSTRPAYEIGTVVGKILINILKNKVVPKQSILLDSELIIRDSAAPYVSGSSRRNNASR
jgi:LacI family transcriptional regulator, repressor for deo operon, udp, cdd, tsx, nupC, and nupG